MMQNNNLLIISVKPEYARKYSKEKKPLSYANVPQKRWERMAIY